MSTQIKYTALTLTAIILLTCSDAAGSKPYAYDSEQAVAKKAAVELMTVLKKELQTAMQTGGPVTAIKICSTRAQALTAEIPVRIGKPDMIIKRTSLKYRNPVNKPTHEEMLVLQRFADQLRDGQPLKPLTERKGKALRYYQPLQVTPLCLACHGRPQDMKAEVRELLRRHYPNDLAVGFAPGDLRGMISITVLAPRQ
jgi:hypothetical protein